MWILNLSVRENKCQVHYWVAATFYNVNRSSIMSHWLFSYLTFAYVVKVCAIQFIPRRGKWWDSSTIRYHYSISLVCSPFILASKWWPLSNLTMFTKNQHLLRSFPKKRRTLRSTRPWPIFTSCSPTWIQKSSRYGSCQNIDLRHQIALKSWFWFIYSFGYFWDSVDSA